jgi:hypothetical protein
MFWLLQFVCVCVCVCVCVPFVSVVCVCFVSGVCVCFVCLLFGSLSEVYSAISNVK